ncbi:hypothetical protein T458_22140 [Brevibacillus panacihumi W25]|uniref:Uncharacterized protein n=1 Tax=Brevibacillus panacihumi W25 TaxID=1408254 RepID=V6M5S0_9BACL|nr:hypothetical protein [Brevibacillus panacihumi]EST53951.1 hypothetical protein T458_22140 [Brevibacillus panacihumi W25]
MNFKFDLLGKILLTFCLLFTFTFTNPVIASPQNNKSKVSIEVTQNNDVFFELVAENRKEDSIYSVRITESEDNQYLWRSEILIEEEIVSETEFIITEIKDNFDDSELEKVLSKVLTGEAESSDLEEYLNKVFKISSEETTIGTRSNQGDEISTFAAPLLIPLAAGAISSSTLAALEAALFATLATATATVATAILEERHRSSKDTAEVKTRNTYPENWSSFTGYPSITSTAATRHIELDGVNEIANRIKGDRNNDGDLEIFISTTDPRDSVLVVFDINSRLTTKVSRHLGNYLTGEQTMDPSFGPERLNLNGYTVFLIFNHRGGNVFHAHFVPQTDRSKELRYMRYRGNFDLKIFDRVSHNPSYNKKLQKTDSDLQRWHQNFDRAINNRNLSRDSNGKRSIVPYK